MWNETITCGKIRIAILNFMEILQESCKKASIICPESEIEALGGCCDMNPEELSAQLNRLNQRLQRESQR